MKLGVIGLPNVGKSTLFNAITQAGAQAANYPFCTIEPNVGVVAVPDKRLDVLAEMYHPEKYTPTTIEFVDIAGLVRGASRGEGLGNKFLSHIREVDAVVHVVRCFEDGNVVHVDGSIDPVRDAETVNLELIFADMDTLQKRIDKNARLAKADKKLAAEGELLQRLYDHLESGKPARTFEADKEEKEVIRSCFLLTDKPVIYVANIAEDDIGSDDNAYVKALYEVARAEGAGCLTVCARIEEEIAELEPAEKAEYLQELGIQESGLDKLIGSAGPYELSHRRTKGGPGLDHQQGHQGSPGRRQDPHGLRTGLHPGRGGVLRRSGGKRHHAGLQRQGPHPLRGQGLRHAGRGRGGLPVQRVG